MLSVEFETPEPFVVGQEIRGYAVWDPRDVTRAKSFQLTVDWRTEGRGDRDRATVARVSVPFTHGQPTSVTRFPFSFVLPPDGPVTYHGRLLRIIWSANARIDVGWAVDPRGSREFVVAPRLL